MNCPKMIAVLFLLGVQPAWSAEPAAKVEMTEGILAMSNGNNQFATEMYSRLRSDEPTNLFFSPYSISNALAMTYVGAAGKTKSQMAEVLHFPKPDSEVTAAFKLLTTALTSKNEEAGFQLRVANRLWGQNDFQFASDYLNVMQADFNAEMGLVDFKKTEAARTSINSWVEEQTDRKIQNLLAPGVLNAATRLVLTNAIYFKARWEHEFSKSATTDAPFHITASQQISIPTMHKTHEFGYFETAHAKILELPYGSDDSLSMLVLLPKKVDGLADLEKQLSSENLGKWSAGLKSQNVKVQLPKFKTTSELGLTDVLGAMGMPLAFSDQADFSKMSTQERLTISAVIHKAFVDVNEEGTEAAAATAVAIRATAIFIDPKKTVEFRADHPFVFLIRHNQSKMVLFLGRLVNPKG